VTKVNTTHNLRKNKNSLRVFGANTKTKTINSVNVTMHILDILFYLNVIIIQIVSCVFFFKQSHLHFVI
jgi:hypothetical protein